MSTDSPLRFTPHPRPLSHKGRGENAVRSAFGAGVGFAVENDPGAAFGGVLAARVELGAEDVQLLLGRAFEHADAVGNDRRILALLEDLVDGDPRRAGPSDLQFARKESSAMTGQLVRFRLRDTATNVCGPRIGSPHRAC